jgi:protein-tyrosine phosphatase
MSREHRDVVLQLTPGKLRQVVPLREFARLAEAVADERILAAAAEGGAVPAERVRLAVASITGTRTTAATSDDDVIDPYRQSSKVYEQAAAELLPAVTQVERVIRLALG